MGSKRILELRSGNIVVVVWEAWVPGEEGHVQPIYSVTPVREHGEQGVRYSHAFNASDLLPLADLLRRIHGNLNVREETAPRCRSSDDVEPSGIIVSRADQDGGEPCRTDR